MLFHCTPWCLYSPSITHANDSYSCNKNIKSAAMSDNERDKAIAELKGRLLEMERGEKELRHRIKEVRFYCAAARLTSMYAWNVYWYEWA